MNKIFPLTLLTVGLWPSPPCAFAQAEGRNHAAISPSSAAETRDAMKSPNEFYSGLAFRRLNTKESVPPLQVQFSVATEKVLESMNEDLVIMSHLLSKTVERGTQDEVPAVKMGVPLLVSAGSPSVRAIYLDGFGALFMIKVGFPLIGPTTAEVRKTDEETDSEWNTAIKELSDDDNDGWTFHESTSAAADFDPAQVETLKSSLLQTLRNASNIRQLNPEEFVAISVFGSPASLTVLTDRTEPGEKSKKPSKGDASKSREVNKHTQVRELAKREARKGTVMTIRVRKSDVDLFAKESLSFDAFQRKVTICSYFGGGFATTSLNSWVEGSWAPVNVAR